MPARPMILTAIAAIDQAGLIGDGLRMPWHLPHDLKRFRSLTLGKPVILGRKTFQSLGKPLPGRLNIVLTRDSAFQAPGCRVAASVDDALAIAREYLLDVNGTEAMIIGGAGVYAATCHRWDRLHLTIVAGKFAGDTYFPIEQADSIPWQLTERTHHAADARNPHPLTFLTLDRHPDSNFRLADLVA